MRPQPQLFHEPNPRRLSESVKVAGLAGVALCREQLALARDRICQHPFRYVSVNDDYTIVTISCRDCSYSQTEVIP